MKPKNTLFDFEREQRLVQIEQDFQSLSDEELAQILTMQSSDEPEYFTDADIEQMLGGDDCPA